MATAPQLVSEQQFKIIKNASPPSLAGRPAKYPFGSMEVGDAFDAPKSLRSKIATAASYWGAQKGAKFSIRTLDEQTFRVWRTA